MWQEINEGPIPHVGQSVNNGGNGQQETCRDFIHYLLKETNCGEYQNERMYHKEGLGRSLLHYGCTDVEAFINWTVDSKTVE